MRTVVRLAAAREDIIQAAVYIAHDSESAAERLILALDGTFAQLARMPLSGRRTDFVDREGMEFRCVRVRHFTDWLVFYRLRDEVIEIVRVLHGARDIGAVLADELAEGDADHAGGES